MEFEWDEDKRRAIIRERGVDVLYAALIFNDFVLTRRDNRKSYGEERMISLGMVESECFVVVHTERRGVTRLITAWKGGRREIREYQARIVETTQPDE